MKKQFSLIVVFLLLVSLQGNSQTMFGGLAGLNLSSASAKAMGETYSPKMKLGFHVGAVANIGLSDHLYLMPGILFSMKGTKLDEDKKDLLGNTYHITEDVTFNYLEIPVNVMYMFGEQGSGRFFISAGPYLGYCFGGKMKGDLTYSNSIFPTTEFDEKLEVGNDAIEDNIRPLDFGLNAGVGYMLPMGLFFRAQYGLGLYNTAPEGDADTYSKNRVIGISVGFLLGGRGNSYR